MRRVIRALAGLVLALLALGLGHTAVVRAQVPPITLPGQTTTTTAAPTTTVPPGTTTIPTTTTLVEATTTTVAVPTEPPPDFGVTVAPSTSTTVALRRVPCCFPTLRHVVDLRPLAASAVTGVYGIGVGAVLIITFVFVTVLSSLRPGGFTMNARRRARLIAGFSCIGLAALVGLIGYLKLSLERDVNRQIPYLASAGMALVLLAVVGGAFIVAEELRQDDERIERLEDAVRTLAGSLAPDIEAPPRRNRS